MACSRCLAARRALKDAVGKAARGQMKAAASSIRQIYDQARESDRIRFITRRKPHG
jgi:hypothetical protein